MKNRSFAGSRVAATLFAPALMIGLFDPYSFGDEGREFGLRSHAWQVAAAARQALLLVVASYFAYSGAHRRAPSVATTESALFLLLNVAFVLRDGTTRFAAGYSADTTVVLALTIGLIARGTAIGLLMRNANASVPTA